ncbi:MAG: YdeI/OmpD-associated family protein [Chitinophagaceae bacterium]
MPKGLVTGTNMIQFTTTIRKFDAKGEKTGWTYIEIPADLAEKLKPGNRQSFRVKGKLDKQKVTGQALIPMGGGAFILPLNAELRKTIRKGKGAMLEVRLEPDDSGFVFNADFMTCLEDEPAAKKFFNSLPGSHQRYFSKWIDSAKTEPTRVKRISMAVSALARSWGYAEMIRGLKK